MLLAIDPGTDTGWALFDGVGPEAELAACGLGDPRSCAKHRAVDVDAVVIEHPFVYPRGQTKSPNDVVKLAINAGEWGGLYRQWADVTYVFPATWKGSVPKDIHHARIWAKLSEAEKGIVDAACRKVAPSKRHNVLDAIGLGLWRAGR